MIKGKMLRDAIISGANNIANERQNVDALNVFPVPDGDTGTNMSMTIGAAKRELERLPDSATVAEVSQVAASALLRGARGNSGVILSLLFRGFSKGLAGKLTANAADIANALSLGVDAAYKAVLKPTEGTILTVGRMAAVSAKEFAIDQSDDVAGIFDAIIAEAAETLAKTPDMLPVLKKAGVVDAGGKGFLIILEGMSTVIKQNFITPLFNPSTAPPQIAPDTSFGMTFEELESQITFFYCTEFIIDKTDRAASPLPLRAFLESIGDSVVVVDDEEIIKVHLHTDNPGKALQQGLTLGSLSRMKIENMREQFEHEHGGKKPPVEQAPKPATEQFDYQPVDPEREYGFVSISAGTGICTLFQDLGVDNVVSGGQTMNPSTEDILKAIHATPAKTVFVLPNNKNIIMAAEQAVKLADRKVFVLHTKTIPQGLSAMLTFEASLDADQNCVHMAKAFEQVSTGQVTFAARDSDFDGHKIKKNEILALDNGKLAFTDTDIVKTAAKLAKNMIKKKENTCAFLTLIYGEGVTEEQAEEVDEIIKDKYPDVEIALIAGNQPVYYFIMSID